MKLTKVHITEFQSIRDSNEFKLGDVTCLVGKNEAGKTALLSALYRLNPIIPADGTYSVTDDYPRWDVDDYRIDVESGRREPATVARAEFEVGDEDVAAVEAVFGKGALPERSFTISKGYANKLHFDLKIDSVAALRHLVDTRDFTSEAQTQLESCDTLDKMVSVIGSLEQTEDVANLKNLLAEIQKKGGLSRYIFNELLWPRTPKFLYFDEYYQMKGQAQIEALKARKEKGNLQPSDYPLLGLINLARLDLDQMLNPSRTRELKNALEGAGNHLTKRVVKYWSQNRYLELRFDVRAARPGDPDEMKSGTNIWGDVYDSKHKVTTELGTRSRGFVWFFSFLAWYGDVQRNKENVILLLDEPGLSLHAKAQADLLRYFDAEVKHQLVYTTHSPFMVDPSRFDRVRIVQDLSIESEKPLPSEKEGTKVLTDVLDATEDSLFPLQGALGYEIHQTLFIGPNSVVVEGPSDLLYIQAVSALLERHGREGLSPRWTLTPVGGCDKVPTFVALIGAQKGMTLATLIDFQSKDRQSIENLYKKKLLAKKRVLTFADFTGTSEADIEDMFEPEFYVALVNEEFDKALPKKLAVSDLPAHTRILRRVETYLESHPLSGGAKFNHYRPARLFSEKFEALAGRLSPSTLDRFERAFQALNALLPNEDKE